jgi:glucosamine--fructose-6-phosphate aminotransferase (isomerizing)
MEKEKPLVNVTYTTNTGFERSIRSVPAGVRELLGVMGERGRNLLPVDVVKKAKNVVITGCGDSLCAAYASEGAFEEFTDLRVDTPTCIDLGRHYSPRNFGAPGETIAMVISTSGMVSRCAEAALRARRNGAVTVAVTANAESSLAQSCDYILDVTLTEFWSERAPGSRNYVGSALAVQMFAAELGVIRGCITEAERDDFYAEIARYNEEWDKAIPALFDKIAPLAPIWNEAPYYEALGSGPEFPTAWFTQAKVFEGINNFARYENFEDWMHVDYFMRKMDSAIILYCASNNPALSRARETETTLTTQGYKYLFVTDADPATFNQPDKVIQVPGSKYAFLNGVFEGLVGCIMFDGIQKIRGNGYYCSDLIDGPFKFGNNFLRNSKIEEV